MKLVFETCRRFGSEAGYINDYSFSSLHFSLTLFSLGGAVLGFTSSIALFPDSDLVITTLSNIYGAALPSLIQWYLVDEILDLPRTKDWLGQEAMDETKQSYDDVAEQERGANLPPRLKNKPAAHLLEEYEGVYSSPLFAGDVTITVETDGDENGLKKSELRFLFNTFTSKIEHYHYETFTFKWDFWSMKSLQLMTFITGQDGKVDAVELEYLEEKITFKKQAPSEEDINGQIVFEEYQAQFRM